MTDVKPTRDSQGRMLPGCVPPGAGRPKGTPNKRTTLAAQKAEDLGIDPLEVLLLLAGNRYAQLNPHLDAKQLKNKEGLPKSVPLEIRRAAATDAAKFIYPTRKAVEVTGEDGGPIEAFLALGEDGLRKRIAELDVALGDDE